MTQKEYDAIVVGTGPAGATAALRLAQAGKKVAILERGPRAKRLGNSLSLLPLVDTKSFIPTPTNPSVIRGIALGGSTLLYCGTATPPPIWLKDKYGIDLQGYADETIEEMGLKPLPDHLLGDGARRIMESANELGYNWVPFLKFIRPDKAEQGFCTGSTCMMGCTCGAKWTSGEFVDQAVELGAELFLKARVERVLIEDGTAVGVLARTREGTREFKGKIIILSAGGIGTPGILLRSGINSAGKKFFTDPVVMVYGISRSKGSKYDPPMSVGTYEHYEERIVLSNLTDPGILFPMMMALARPTRFWQALMTHRALGIMVKVGDEMNGEIFANESIRKPMQKTEKDRLKKGSEIAQKILVKAGADPNSIATTPIRLTHPGGTASIGEVVNENLETEVKNLFCCDASVIPETLDLPVVLTVICFGKRLANYLLQNRLT